MLIDIRCPKCGTTFKTSDDFAGMQVQCANSTCSEMVTVPQALRQELRDSDQMNLAPKNVAISRLSSQSSKDHGSDTGRASLRSLKYYHFWMAPEDIRREIEDIEYYKYCFASGGDEFTRYDNRSPTKNPSQFVIPDLGMRLEEVADAILCELKALLGPQWTYGLASKHLYPDHPGSRRTLRFFTNPREGCITGYDIHFEDQLNFLRIGFRDIVYSNVHYNYRDKSELKSDKSAQTFALLTLPLTWWFLILIYLESKWAKFQVLFKLRKIDREMNKLKDSDRDVVLLQCDFKKFELKEEMLKFFETHYPGYVDLKSDMLAYHIGRVLFEKFGVDARTTISKS